MICALEKKYLKLSDLWMMKMWWTIPSCLQKFAPWEKHWRLFWLPSYGLPGLSCPLSKSPWILRRSWPHKSEDDMHNVQYFAQFSFIKFFFFHFIFSMIYGKISQPWALWKLGRKVECFSSSFGTKKKYQTHFFLHIELVMDWMVPKIELLGIPNHWMSRNISPRHFPNPKPGFRVPDPSE